MHNAFAGFGVLAFGLACVALMVAPWVAKLAVLAHAF